MRKIALFLHHKERYDLLVRLQELGLVDVDLESDTIAEKHSRLKALHGRIERTAAELEALAARDGRGSVAAGAPANEPPWPAHITNPEDRVQYLEDRFFIRDSFVGALSELRQKHETLRPWGEFDAGRLAELAGHGVRIRFFLGSARVFDEHDFGELCIEEIAREEDRVYFLLIEYGPTPAVLPFRELPPPTASPSEIESEIALLEEHLAAEGLAAFVPALPEMRSMLADLETQMQYEQTRHNLQSHESEIIYHITGWYPVSNEKSVRDFLERTGVAYQIEEPQPEDAVPIKLRNRPGARLFEPITRIFSLPNYFELDPTLFFAPFFTVFFGLCLGDVGYGAILTVASLFGLALVPRAYRALPALGLVLGLSTVVAGVLLNSFFGKALFAVPGETGAVFAEGGQFALFASYTVQGRTTFPAMTLALLLGFVQLVFGIVLQSVNAWRMRGPLHALKPVGMALMLLGGAVVAVHGDFLRLGFNADFAIGPLAVGPILSSVPQNVGGWLALGGLAVFFLFSDPDARFILRPLVGLWDFYQFLTGLLGDFLSYIRLFALGLASGLLGNAFNNIAFMVLPRTADGVQYLSPWIILTVLILLLGHTLNLGLSMLGAFVHPLRLTFVEFYKNIQFVGGGREYRPFAVKKHQASEGR